MYTDRNFKKGTEVREAVARYLLAVAAGQSGREVTFYQPGGMFPTPKEGQFVLEGPHYPAPHSWYLTAVAKEGRIVWVNGLPAILNPENPKFNLAAGIAALRKKYPELAAQYQPNKLPV